MEEYKNVVLPSDEEALKRMKLSRCDFIRDEDLLDALIMEDSEKLVAMREKIAKMGVFNAELEVRFLAADEDGKKKMIGEYKSPNLDE